MISLFMHYYIIKIYYSYKNLSITPQESCQLLLYTRIYFIYGLQRKMHQLCEPETWTEVGIFTYSVIIKVFN